MAINEIFNDMSFEKNMRSFIRNRKRYVPPEHVDLDVWDPSIDEALDAVHTMGVLGTSGSRFAPSVPGIETFEDDYKAKP